MGEGGRGKGGLVLRVRWGGHGSLALSPPGEARATASQPPGHRDTLPGRPPTAILRAQLRGGMTGEGGGALLDCQMARVVLIWRVPHSHGPGAHGSWGTPSAGYLREWPPGCGAAAPFASGALRAHYWTGLSWGGKGRGRLAAGLRGSPTTAVECTGLCWHRWTCWGWTGVCTWRDPGHAA